MASLSARTAAVTVLGQTVGRGLTVVAVIASTAIVTRTVGVDTYADWATALSLVAMLAFLLDPGITPIVVRRLAQDPTTVPTARDMLRARLRAGRRRRAARRRRHRRAARHRRRCRWR